MNKPTVTAAALRSFFNADPKRLAALSPEARKTVEYVDGKAPKGRLHREAVEVHNKRRKVQYVTGATKDATGEARAQALTARVQAFEKGLAVGRRGPLSKEAKQVLGLTK